MTKTHFTKHWKYRYTWRLGDCRFMSGLENYDEDIFLFSDSQFEQHRLVLADILYFTQNTVAQRYLHVYNNYIMEKKIGEHDVNS